MKKLILFAALMFSFSASADWKEDMVYDLTRKADELGGKLSKDLDFNASASGITYNIFSMFQGMCVEFSSASRSSMPQELIDLFLDVSENLMRGKNIDNQSIRHLGLACLTHVENSLIKTGISKEDLENHFVPILKKQLDHVFRQLIQ